MRKSRIVWFRLWSSAIEKMPKISWKYIFCGIIFQRFATTTYENIHLKTVQFGQNFLTPAAPWRIRLFKIIALCEVHMIEIALCEDSIWLKYNWATIWAHFLRHHFFSVNYPCSSNKNLKVFQKFVVRSCATTSSYHIFQRHDIFEYISWERNNSKNL